ncbi:MAG: Lrp/AsnC family transcriptional regulator [Deltaproteobacteria bacterium]|jgi:Lrp/AsnC family transcriptional regulator, leucine-responsive regulatory protein|nr:Lrp/AsnC family transcriptional regulator [Deltaproteobacteria bacterium]MBT6432291.1 Lrp/AsnC family transcriptional regulator [Deltaproteobacteria bacterium]MBT6490304.1 Lrp/AsnC family transcriptional regulator [Deltaproteobacteria bacterium]
MPIFTPDEIDHSIITALQKDGRLSNVQLAQMVNLSESACLRRVKMLERSGVIDRYVMLVNQAASGKPDNVFIQITLDRQQQEDFQHFENAIRAIPEVMECYLMTGTSDYLVRVVVRDTSDYERLHTKYLTRLPGVVRVQSSFALRTVTKKTQIPMDASH